METSKAQRSDKGKLESWSEFMDGGEAGFRFQIRCESFMGDASMQARPSLWPEKRNERIEWSWRRYLLKRELSEAIPDDGVPCLDMLSGTEIFAEAFGCRVERPDHSNPFAMPLVQSASEAAKLKVPKIGSCSLDRLFEMADELKSRAGGEALFRMPDLQCPMDIASLVWNKESLLMALYDEPEAVKELATKVRELLAAFLDEWFRRYGESFVAHYPDYPMKRGITLSVDEVGSIGPELFEEFYLPELAWLSERYGGLGIHCCADSRHQWGNFKRTPGLKIVNICKPPNRGEDFAADSLEAFGESCVQYPYVRQLEGPIESWRGQFPKGSRIVLDIEAKSLDEARSLAEKARKALGS